MIESAQVTNKATPFVEATDHFRRKLRLPIKTYRDLSGECHAKAFMIAGATNDAMLADFQREIQKALDASDVILLCLSKKSVDKEGYVQREIRVALDRALEMPEGRIFLIPARLEECELPHRLKSYQWVDLFSEGGMEKLIKSLNLRAKQVGAKTLLVK